MKFSLLFSLLLLSVLLKAQNNQDVPASSTQHSLHVDSALGFKAIVPEWLKVKETGNDKMWGGLFPPVDKIANTLMITGFDKDEFDSFEHFKTVYITGNKFGKPALFSENHIWYGYNPRDLQEVEGGVSCRVFTIFQNRVYHNQFVLIETKSSFIWVQFVASPDTYEVNLPKFNKFLESLEIFK